MRVTVFTLTDGNLSDTAVMSISKDKTLLSFLLLVLHQSLEEKASDHLEPISAAFY